MGYFCLICALTSENKKTKVKIKVMKKIIVLAIMALVTVNVVKAQNAKELAEQKRELNSIHMKMLNAKPSKDAKRQAKELKKAGWMVIGSGKSIEKQITDDQLIAEELMTDEGGNITKRFIQHSASSVAGTQNAAYAAARAACQSEIAAMLETRIAGAMEQKLDNSQSSAITANTVDKFHQRIKSIIDQCLSRSTPGLNIYRVLQNNNFESQVTLSFDKTELVTRIKRQLQKELEVEGDELKDLVDEVMGNWE